MDLVKIQNTAGPVTVVLTITGAVSWSYDYDARDYEYRNTGSSSAPNQHALGLPAELDHDVHKWSIRLANVTSTRQRYTVDIVWEQAGAPVARWPQTGSRTGALDPDAIAVESDDALLVAV
jgi:hypothetical protein